MKFKEKYLAGEIPFEEIDAYVEAWGNSDEPCTLREYLGLNEEEEDVWISGRNAGADPCTSAGLPYTHNTGKDRSWDAGQILPCLLLHPLTQTSLLYKIGRAHV